MRLADDLPQGPAEREAQREAANVIPLPAPERVATDYVPTYLDLEALEEAGEPPARVWAIDHWLGMGYVTLLAAKGGRGKSLLALQLAVSLGLGRSFIAPINQQRNSLVWMGEDDDDELWRRMHAIAQ